MTSVNLHFVYYCISSVAAGSNNQNSRLTYMCALLASHLTTCSQYHDVHTEKCLECAGPITEHGKFSGQRTSLSHPVINIFPPAWAMRVSGGCLNQFECLMK